MTKILTLFHPFFAVDARVKGTKINVTAADKRASPPTSRSYQVRRMTLTKSVRLLVRFLIKFNLWALRWLKSSVRASGRKDAGKIIAHIP